MLRVKLWAAFAFLGLLLILFLLLVSAGVTGTSETEESGVPPTAEMVTNKTQEGERSSADSEEMEGENWRTAKQWGVRFFRWIVIPLAVLILIALTILLYNRERITLKGLGVIFLVVVVIGLLAILGHKTYKWWLSRPAATTSAVPDERSATTARAALVPRATTTVTSRVTTKTIIARPKPEELKLFRPNAILPFWHQCDWSLSGGCVKVENGRGESVISCPGQKPTGELSASNQLAFWSLESEKEVTVSIVCEPE